MSTMTAAIVCCQVRPGDVMTYILAVMGLMALLGGGLTSLALLLIWGISRQPSASTDQRQGGKTAHSDEVSSEAGWSEVSSGAFLLRHIMPCYCHMP